MSVVNNRPNGRLSTKTRKIDTCSNNDVVLVYVYAGYYALNLVSNKKQIYQMNCSEESKTIT